MAAQAKRARWTNETIVLYKSHRFESDLLELCASFVVLLTHSGCIEATVLSAVNAGFLELSEANVVSFLQGMFHELFLWRHHAALDVGSTDLRAQPLHSAALVHHALGVALGAPYSSPNSPALQTEVARESNPNIPHREASAETKALLRKLMHAAKLKLAYDKRVVGWQWLC